jgi:CheY-like chemotaxis protein
LCDCGEAALKESLNDFDLVFMDCQMPGMDGLEATREIRKIEKNQSLEDKSHIVAMTANALEGDRRACIDAGMDDFISKPVQISELKNVISKALGGIEIEDIAVTTPSLPKETLQEILPMYITQAREQVVAIETAAKSGDRETIMQIAHQLKGSSANLGVSALAGLCGQIENAAADGTDVMDSLVADLGRQLEIAETQLRRMAR